MPRVNIYLSDLDYERWQIIDNKSQFVSEALARGHISGLPDKPGKVKMTIPKTGGVKKTESPKPAGISGAQYDSYYKKPKTLEDVPSDFFARPDRGTCKHGAVRGLCKKGCK